MQTISQGHVAAAAFVAAKGEWNDYVQLAKIRALLGGADPVAYADAARSLQSEGMAVLYPIDFPPRRTREDDAAAIRVCGQRRDLVCVQTPSVTTLRRWVREVEATSWGTENQLLDALCRQLAAFEEC